jgi:hypothetical protein
MFGEVAQIFGAYMKSFRIDDFKRLYEICLSFCFKFYDFVTIYGHIIRWGFVSFAVCQDETFYLEHFIIKWGWTDKLDKKHT